MKTLDPALQAHLQTGLTTLCYCWRLTLQSGERLGFTDHDVALNFDNTIFEPQAGFSASEIESSLGLSVDNLEASGALSSTQLSDTRLAAGDFDHAQIEVWKVNWQDPSQRVLQRKGHLGEVSYGQGAFKAEVRGLAHLLNQKRGRLYRFGCDAILGDARCGVNLVPFTSAAVITALHDGGFDTSLPAATLDDWFTRGQVAFLSGANAGRKLEIKRQRMLASSLRIELWDRPRFTIAIGESVNLVAGCDKQLSTCTAKFANAVNFRGFPHMPGNDFVAKVAAASDPNNNGLKR
jgi:uncharacterized phage protein (TIGR02218 family)